MSRPLLLLALLNGTPGGGPEFTAATLQPGGWIVSATSAPGKDPARRDLIFQILRRGTRRLVLFRQGPAGFPGEPSASLPVPPEAFAFVALEAGAVLFLTPQGLKRAPWPDGEGKRPSPPLPPLLLLRVTPHRHRCYAWPARADLDGDGRLDLLLPTRTGYRVLLQPAPGRFRLGPALAAPRTEELRSEPDALVVHTQRLPLPFLADGDGDGRTDVFFFWEGEIRFHRQAKQGLPREPTARVRPPWLGAKQPGEVTLDRILVADVDGDGPADLLIVRKRGRVGLFATLRTQVLFFRGPFWDRPKPDQILNLLGLARRPSLVDLNGDGQQDLFLATLETGLESTWRPLLGQGLPARFAVLPFARGRFQPRPLASLRRLLPFRKLLHYGALPLVRFLPDLDGDGTGELVEALPEGGLRGLRGEREGGRVAFREILFRAPHADLDTLFAADLTGEGRPDLVAFHGTEGVVVLCR